MKTLAVVQNKGGVGKTMLTRLLADYFGGRHKLRTLLLDLDAQCNLSRRFLGMEHDPVDVDGVLPPVHPDYDPGSDDWSGRSGSADIYRSGLVYPYPSVFETVDVIPGHGPSLRDVELVTRADVQDRVHERLKQFLSMQDVRDAYDLVLIDTAPAKGPLTISAVRAATHLLIPTAMEPQPVEGLFGMLQLWRQELRKRNPDDPSLEIAAIQPNLMRRGVALNEGILDSLRRDDAVAPLLSPVTLHQRVAFAESDHPHATVGSVLSLRQNDPARIEALGVCQYIAKQLGLELNDD